jgi:hypothetical protein
MKTIKTIHGDGFTVYVMKGAEDRYYVEYMSAKECDLLPDTYSNQESAFAAAYLLAHTQSTGVK